MIVSIWLYAYDKTYVSHVSRMSSLCASVSIYGTRSRNRHVFLLLQERVYYEQASIGELKKAENLVLDAIVYKLLK